MVVTQMRDFVRDVEHGFRFFGVRTGRMTINYSAEGPQRGTWQVIGLKALNTLNWMKKLSPAQRQLLGLPADESLLTGSEDGLHEVERLFQNRFRALKQEKRDLCLDVDGARRLLSRLARGLMHVPGGGRVSVSREKMGQIIGVEDQLGEVFKEIVTSIGFLVEEPEGYFRFADTIFEYFTSVG